MAHSMAPSTSSSDDGTRLRTTHHPQAWMSPVALPPAAPVGVIGAGGGSAVTLKPPLEPAPLVPQPRPPLLLPHAAKPRRKRRMCRGDASTPQMTAIATEPAMCKPLICVAHTPAASVRVASATATAASFGAFNDSDNDGTMRARVQRLLVQCVLLPVVWVSLCCVITAAMGIECVETLQKALTYEPEDARDDMNDRPTKKAKRSLREGDELRLKQAFPKPPHTTEESNATTRSDELVHKKRKASVNAYVDDGDDDEAKARVRVRSVSHVLAATTKQSRPRRRRVLIWDLDETLVLFASLYSGQFARTHEKELATSVALGEQMMTYLVAVLERHFYFSDLHDADVDHITSVQDVVDGSETPLEEITKGTPSYSRVVADRYTRIRAIYERRNAVDFLDDPTSQWFAARHALVASIDAFSTGWIREARELLELTSRQRRVETGDEQQDDEEVINVMVTNTQLSPALCKCLIYGLDAYFPIDAVYSSSKLHKLKCFQTIVAKYSNRTPGETSSSTATQQDDDVEFIAIGDGAEEEHVSHALGLSFFKIRSLDDLKQLRYELQLVERPQATEAHDAPATDGVQAQQ